MEQSFENGLYYFIEFAKILLAVVYIWRMRPKKTIGVAFAISLFLVMLVSCYYDLSDISGIYGIIGVLIIFFFTTGKHRTGLAALSYVFISMLDMIFSNLIMWVFQIPAQTLQPSVLVRIEYNTVSLFVIIIYILLFRKRAVQSKITGILLPIYILGGVALSVFLTALLLVKLDSAYHNVIFAGLGMAVVFFMCVCVLLEHNNRENERLKTENDMNNKMLETQSKYYMMLLQKESETKAFRHDIKEQFVCMRVLYENEQYEELGVYISEMQTAVAELSSRFNIGNDYVSAIVTDLSSQYDSVTLEWSGKLPDLNLSYMDICTLFYNLLKNAFEAAEGTKGKWVKVAIRIQELNLFIHISNCYSEIIRDNKGEFQSTKLGEGHGYGVRNIKKCVEKNRGECSITVDDGIFQTEIILPNAVKKVNF